MGRLIKICFMLFIYLLLIFGYSAKAQTGNSYYVSPTGSDVTGDGSSGNPWGTIQYGIDNLGTGDTLILKDGTYYPDRRIRIYRGGIPEAWNTLRAEHKWGAKIIVPTNDSVNFYAGIGIGNWSGEFGAWVNGSFYFIIDGIEVQGGYDHAIQATAGQNIIIRNCKFHASGRDAIKINSGVGRAVNVTIENNEIYNTGVRDSTNCEGIDATSTDYLTIRNNHIHDIPRWGLYIKKGSEHALVENNIIHDINYGGISLGESTVCYDCIARNNILYNIGYACLQGQGAKDSGFYHNTCYNVTTQGWGGLRAARAETLDGARSGDTVKECENLVFKNNIIVINSDSNRMFHATDPSFQNIDELTLDNNLYYNLDPSQLFYVRYHSHDEYSLADWQTWSQQRSLSEGGSGKIQDEKSFYDDPLFVSTDPSSPDFLKLSSNSPAIDAGADLSEILYDYNGIERPKYTGWDIGAHEYISYKIYYLSPSGDDSNDGLTESTPWKSFSHAFSTMSGGDELILLDGTYSEAAGTGYISYLGTNSAQPPSGTPGQMTVIRAKNPGNVKIFGEMFIGRSYRKDSYIKIQGITFEGGGTLYNTDHIYVKECGFHSETQSAGSVFGIGTNDHEYGNNYNLIEDCWVWGKERLIAANYRSDNNVWRRVVVRGDGCNSASCTGSGNPNVGITIYDSKNVSYQNLIVVDRILDGGSPAADFATAQHTPEGHWFGPNEWLGCISLKSPEIGFSLECDHCNDNTWSVKNCVAWGANQVGLNSQNYGVQSEPVRNIFLNHFTSGEALNHDGIRIRDIGSGTVKNLIIYNSGRHGYNSNTIQPAYVDVYGSTDTDYRELSPSIGGLTTDPTNDGTPPSLLYLTRIEDSSALDNAGDGGDYGANIVKRYGIDGTTYDETGYNTLTGVDLWPWPNEDRIKKEMCTDMGETRGFCNTGTGIYGGPVTLSSYIWEVLNNPCPSEVCLGGPVLCENDQDGDGYGTGTSCLGPDCNDNNPDIHDTISCSYNGFQCGTFDLCTQLCPIPPAETCDNSQDDDCDGQIDCLDSDCYSSSNCITVTINIGEDWKYFKGMSQPPADWNNVAFDDSLWLTGPTGIGYGDGDDATVLSDMQGNYLTVYLRKSFSFNGNSVNSMVLETDYDDGFVAYINGNEVARRNVAGIPNYDSPASDYREAGTMEQIDLTSFSDLIQNGNNVLAIEVHNQELSSSDLSMIPYLEIKGAMLSYHRSDTNLNGCIETGEMIAFMDRWKISSTDVSMAELMESISLRKAGTGCS